MSRMFEIKKESLNRDLERYQQGKRLIALGCEATEREWRAVILFHAKTVVKGRDGEIALAGPVVCGIRYHERFLSEAPHPMEIVTILEPRGVFHPNCSPSGAMCLGHPTPGLTLESILNQVWAGVNLNMKVVDTRPGNIVNRDAARWVVANAQRFPLCRHGLLEGPA